MLENITEDHCREDLLRPHLPVNQDHPEPS
jgi:hypothetical protein